MEEIIKTGTQAISQFIEFLAALIIAYSSIKAVSQYFKDSFSRASGYLLNS